MNAPRKVTLFSTLIVVALLVSACASAAATAVPQFSQASGASRTDAAALPPVEATAAPAPTSVPAAVEIASANQSALGGVSASPYRANRLIIKNGEMSLRVVNVDRSIDQVTDIAVTSGGYVVSSRTWTQDDLKFATLTLGVPVDQFEAVQRQLRAIAVDVLSDTAAGQDVSDEYVDLQSRLTNLEATAARIREFLAQATKVEEALAVNSKLTEVEGEIEQVKGRMNYLKDRSAFSTMAVNLEQQPPEATPTPTPTPAAWMPEKTFNAAAGTLGNVLRAFGDLVIWFGVVIAPFAVPVAIVGAVRARGRRKKMS